MCVAFYDAAFQLLGIEGLPLPRMDGHNGDTYFNSNQFQQLAIRVCELVPGMTIRDWRESNQQEQTALMEAALMKREQRTRPEFHPHPANGETRPSDAQSPEAMMTYDLATLPRKYRDDKSIHGELLIPRYLRHSPKWDLDGNDLRNGLREGHLTDRVRVKTGRRGPPPYAYAFDQLAAYQKLIS